MKNPTGILKKCFFLILLLIFIFSFTSAQPGLIGYYPLDSSAVDSSGNNYHGTAFNVTSVPDQAGRPNGALHFSGSLSYISIPTTGYLLNEYTYSLWCRPTAALAVNEGVTVFSIGGMIADQAMQLVNVSPYGPVFGGFGYDTNVIAHGCTSFSNPVSINTWYHVVLTRNDSVIRFYMDDTLRCNVTFGPVSAGYLGSSITASIGKRSGTVPQYFNGDIDEVKIFNRVLDSSEIHQLYLNHIDLTSVGSPDLNPIRVYPSVTATTVTVENGILNSTFYLNDVSGRLVMNGKLQSSRSVLDLSDLKKGVYFLTIEKNGSRRQIKIIKE